jgi:hypothetical protein
MSTEVPLPRTAVPLGITDPVERARAELKAALAAIEEKSNVPKRVAVATDRGGRGRRRCRGRRRGARGVGPRASLHALTGRPTGISGRSRG